MTISDFVVVNFNGKTHFYVEHHHDKSPSRPQHPEDLGIIERYELSEGQALLTIDELKILREAGTLKKWMPPAPKDEKRGEPPHQAS